jgi:hypothetical protein
MPKQRRERTQAGVDRDDPTGKDINPRKKTHSKDMKRRINEILIENILKDKNIIRLLYSWLIFIRGKYHTTRRKSLISLEQLKNELIQGFMLLNTDLEDVKASPLASNLELEGLDVTAETAKYQQLKKDKWMNDYIKGDIKEWLANDEIIEILQGPNPDGSISAIPVMDYSEGSERYEDLWVDIGTLYNETTSKVGFGDIGIQINVGKLRNGREDILEIFRLLQTKAMHNISRAFELLMKIGMFIPIKISGHVIRMSTEIVFNTILGIIKSKPGLSLMLNVLHSLFGPAFTISDDPRSAIEALDTKYKVLLALTFQKTLFSLSKILSSGNVNPENVSTKINQGLSVLNNYVNGDLSSYNPGQKIEITNVMFSLDKLIEWYLMRRTTVIYNSSSKDILLLENKKELREMSAAEIDSASLEPEPEPDTASKRKNKRTKRKRKSSKKKKKRKKPGVERSRKKK